MNVFFLLLGSCVASILFSTSSYADSAEIAWAKLVGEKYIDRPEFAFVNNDPSLPNVLIYGDSISMAYTERVRKDLKGKANVYRIYCNGGGTERVIPAMTKMHKHMAEYWNFKWDVIHFNVGLHDIRYLDKQGNYDTEKGKLVSSIGDYMNGIKRSIEFFKNLSPKVKIIFATTTPVPKNAVGRIVGDAEKYNAAALEVLRAYPTITVNDLYAFSKPYQSQWWRRPGNVHYNQVGATAQGDQVARVIAQLLKPDDNFRNER